MHGTLVQIHTKTINVMCMMLIGVYKRFCIYSVHISVKTIWYKKEMMMMRGPYNVVDLRVLFVCNGSMHVVEMVTS